MSLDIIKKATKDFVSNYVPEVLSIKGGWGVGKTYFWNTYLKENCTNLSLSKYAYVSLFGISSIEELKLAIFENLIDKDQFNKSSLNNLKRNAKKAIHFLPDFLRKIPKFGGYVPTNTAFITTACFSVVKNALICIDDVERTSLSIQDILGLVSILKEQKDCKVVLIFDDSKLEGIAEKDYKRFREKVIDIEITYAPNAEEAAKIVFSEENEINKQVIKLTTKLNIMNIRILKKIRKAAYSVAKTVESVKPKLEPELLQQSLPSIVLFVWCYYSHDENIPSYDYLKNLRYKWTFFREPNEGEEDKRSEKEKKWDAILRQYGYGETNEFDLALATVVETGYVNEQLLEEATKYNEQIKANKSQNSWFAAWKFYHNTFTDNKGQLIDAFNRSIRDNARYISRNDLDGAISLIKALGEKDLASELIDIYINANRDKPSIFDLDSPLPKWRINDEEIIKKFNSISNEIKEIKTLEDVVEKISKKNGWSQSEEEILASATVDDYYKLFKRQEGEHLSAYVDSCLLFDRVVNSTERQKKIVASVKEALIRIGKESELNKMRVQKFRIDV